MGEQKARMLRSEWYLDEPDLREDRWRCWRLLDRFNATTADDDQERCLILDQLVAKLGDGAVVMPRFQCSYGTQITLGANSFVNHDALFMDDAMISIGDDVRIGPRAQLLTALHPVRGPRPTTRRLGASAPDRHRAERVARRRRHRLSRRDDRRERSDRRG